ncbi:MAG: 4Fe-4S binding protein, partial [Dehalococcoidia bacterium]
KKYDNVLTGLEFERLTCAAGPTEGKILLKDGREPESVAIVHCVGSRDQNYHEYCSRVCCMYGLKHAHLIKEHTNAEVYEFYIDMRCFGENHEEFYSRVSEEGVNFIRGKVGSVDADSTNGKLIVSSVDTSTSKILRIPVDMVILCPALEPRSDAADIARIFNMGRRADGFFLELHPKLAPVNTPTDGVFIAGCCEGPKDIPDTVAQASAAAAEALSLISRGRVTIEASNAVIDEEKCAGCGLCELLCPFQAVELQPRDDRMVSHVNEALCKGCGTCCAACRSGAITMRHFTDQQILAQIEGMLV